MSVSAIRRKPKDIADLHKIAGRENLLQELGKHMVDDKPVPTPAMTNTTGAAVEVAPERTTRNTELSAILDEISIFLRRYIVFPSREQTLVTTLWIVHTWILDAFDYTPYLNISSPEKQCGKSKLLDCLRQLVAKPLAAASATPAALFRKIEEKRPTILLDEVDTVFSAKKDDGSEHLRALLNAGFERDGAVLRCEGNNHSPKEFSVFCPKALVGIGKLPETVNDRCIPIRLARRTPAEPVERFRKRDAKLHASTIRDRLEKWASMQENINALQISRPQLPNELSDRQYDICEPLVALADYAGGDRPHLARLAVVKLLTEENDVEGNLGALLLTDIRDIFNEQDIDKLSSRDLLEHLIKKETSPWSLWWGEDLSENKIRGAAAQLARKLKPYQVTPRVLNQSGLPSARGYHRKDFEEVWRR